MPRYKKVDAELMDKPQKRTSRGRPVSAEQRALVNRMKQITDETIVFEAVLQEGDKPATVRAQLVRAAKLADVEVAIKKSAAGFYFGLRTPSRATRRGRPRKAAASS
jgi:hypothetical protein